MYIPILKSKFAEFGALSDLYDNDMGNILPYIEVIPLDDKAKNIVDEASKLVNKIWRACNGQNFILDFTLAIGCGEYCDKVLENLSNLRMNPILAVPEGAFYNPVELGFILEMVDKYEIKEICLRIFPDRIKETEDYNNYINSLRYIIERGHDDITFNLMLDFKDKLQEDYYEQKVDSFIRSGVNELFVNTVIAGGAFPKDMSSFSLENPDNREPRKDWKLWKKYCAQYNLSFADYTIRHPVYDDTATMHSPSATIKYTLEDEWKILKGQRWHSEHYIGNAELLIKGNDFSGSEYSAGDKYIYDTWSNRNSGKTGNAKTWLRAGINHHMTVTSRQIRELDGSK